MIDFRFSVDIDGVERAFHALADSLEDVTVPLLRTGGHIRSRARKLFAGEGNGKWPALAPSTLKRKMTSAEVKLLRIPESGKVGERSIVQKIVRDAAGISQWENRAAVLADKIEAARKKGRKTKGLEARRSKAHAQSEARVEKILRAAHLGQEAGIVKAAKGQSQYVALNELITYARREVARSKAHGRVQRAVKQLQRAGYHLSDAERRSQLRQGARRYKASEASTRMLGGLENTLGMQVTGVTVSVYSKAFISGIHNDGGVAGHGANIPAREFLNIEESDLDVFVEALNEAAIEAWTEA